MNPELMMLLGSAILLVLLVLTYGVAGAIPQFGLPYIFSNRDAPKELTGWAARCQRAHRNLLENLLPFAIVVLVVVASGKTNGSSALGAQIFFGARVVHALCYVAGITVLRTVAFNAGIVGIFMVASASL